MRGRVKPDGERPLANASLPQKTRHGRQGREGSPPTDHLIPPTPVVRLRISMPVQPLSLARVSVLLQRIYSGSRRAAPSQRVSKGCSIDFRR